MTNSYERCSKTVSAAASWNEIINQLKKSYFNIYVLIKLKQLPVILYIMPS